MVVSVVAVLVSSFISISIIDVIIILRSPCCALFSLCYASLSLSLARSRWDSIVVHEYFAYLMTTAG